MCPKRVGQGVVLLVMLMATDVADLHGQRIDAQRVAVRSASAQSVTVVPEERPNRVTIQGTNLRAVTGAAVEVMGEVSADIEVRLGRLTRSGLPLSITVVAEAGMLEGELVLLTRDGSVATGVVVVVEAPRFEPIQFRSGSLAMTGWRVDPVSFRADVLSMSGWRADPVSFRADVLSMTGWRYEPVTIRTPSLTMVGHRSDRKENR